MSGREMLIEEGERRGSRSRRRSSNRTLLYVVGGVVAVGVIALIIWLVTSAPAGASPSTNTTHNPQCHRVRPSRPFKTVRDANASNVIFFHDGTNFDDVVALHLLLKSPRANLRAVYIAGNAWGNVGPSFDNVLRILHLYGKAETIPVFAGSYAGEWDTANPTPSVFAPTPQLTYRSIVPSRPGGAVYCDTMWSTAALYPQGRAYDIYTSPSQDVPAVDDPVYGEAHDSLRAMTLLLENQQGAVDFLVTGTWTPVIRLMRHLAANKPNLLGPQKIRHIYALGGAVNTTGNVFTMSAVNEKAEFNILGDPHAASWSFHNASAHNISIQLVPLDATNDVPFTRTLLNTLAGNDQNGMLVAPGPQTPEAEAVGILMRNLQKTWWVPDNFHDGPFGQAYLWDPTSVIVMLYPELVVTHSQQVDLDVSYSGNVAHPDEGWTRVCASNEGCPSIDVVYDVNGTEVNRIILDLMQSPDNSAVRSLAC